MDEIRHEFRQKDGLYCLLFSTPCIASAKFPGSEYINKEKWKISYSEWLARNPSPKIEIEMFYGGEEERCHANVAIRARQKSPLMEETFELGFRLRRDEKWMLEATPAWPEGIARDPNTNWKDQELVDASHGS